MAAITTKRFAAPRFYWRLLLRAPKVAWEALGHFGNFALLVLAVLFLVNRPLARSISAWEGMSPWWAIGPFVIFFLTGLLTANYRLFLDATAPHVNEGPEIEIEELIDSRLDPTAFGDAGKIKINKASNCEFKTDVPGQAGSADDGGTAA